jgi:hypothetical protein
MSVWLPECNVIGKKVGLTCHAAVEPVDFNTYPDVPIPKRVALFAPLPKIKSPVDVIGDKLLKAALADVAFVPPLAMDTGAVRLKTVPVRVRPLPAEYVPVPENCDQEIGLVPTVVTGKVCTQPVFPYCVP